MKNKKLRTEYLIVKQPSSFLISILQGKYFPEPEVARGNEEPEEGLDWPPDVVKWEAGEERVAGTVGKAAKMEVP